MCWPLLGYGPRCSRLRARNTSFMKRVHATVSRWINLATKKTNASEHRGDGVLFLLVLALSVFGLIMVYNASTAIALRDFGSPFFFIKEQLMWFCVGLVALFITSRITYTAWYVASVPFIVVTLCLLIAVFLPVIGVRVMGASRWINLGFTSFQPSEFAKLAVILYLAAWLCKKEQERFSAFLFFLGATVGLVLLQPDMGTSIILLIISLTMYFISGAPIKQFLGLVPVIVIILLVLALAAPYRLQRITTFLNPERDPYGASYQIRQALLGIGSGGVFGVGAGKSRQKHDYLPEANTDAIFAIVAEEFGLIGSSIVLLGYLFVLWRLFRIARRSPDLFARLIIVGVIAWFGLQSAINIGAIIALFPLTGVPLPFISYGGSSLVVLLSAFGIVLNISKYTK